MNSSRGVVGLFVIWIVWIWLAIKNSKDCFFFTTNWFIAWKIVSKICFFRCKHLLQPIAIWKQCLFQGVGFSCMWRSTTAFLGALFARSEWLVVSLSSSWLHEKRHNEMTWVKKWKRWCTIVRLHVRSGKRFGEKRGKMREIVHLQAGQCGNQIGAKVRGH